MLIQNRLTLSIISSETLHSRTIGQCKHCPYHMVTGDSVRTTVCSSVILLSTFQCFPHRGNQNSAVHASTLYLYLTKCQLFLQWSCWSVEFPVTDCAKNNLPTVCAVVSGRNFKATWLVLVVSTSFLMTTNQSQPPLPFP